MKKLLLVSLVFIMAASSFAQKGLEIRKHEKRIHDSQIMAAPQTKPIPKYVEEINNRDEVTRVEIGMSAHQRPLRREEAHIIYYNAELDVIGVTSILDPETYPNVNEMGIIGLWYSIDKGATWSDPVILNNDLTTGPNYYMAGALYNPTGNTSVDDMFGFSQGVLNMGGGDWNYKTFGSATLTGDYQTNYIFEGLGDDGYWNIFGLDQVNDEMRLMNLIPGGPWGAYTSATFQPITAEFDNNEFDFDLTNTVEANMFNEPADGVMSWIGMWQGMDAGCEAAWSNDGEIGYMWMVGVSDEDPTGYQPVVFMTEDGGSNWDYIYLDFLDNDFQDYLENYLIPATSGDFIPHVFESAGVVDGNGDLQMIVAMGSSSADVTIYPDSIGYHWVYPGDLFNVSVDADGLKEVLWIDSLRTDNVLNDTEGNYCGEGWQHRLSAGKSPNEMQVFFTWTETLDETQDNNVAPDLFGWSRAYDEPDNYYTEPVCFTEGTTLAGKYWFTSGAEDAYLNNGGKFTLPYMQGCTPPEFYGNTSTSTDPITFNYITGIEFEVLIPIGVEEFNGESGFSVSQNSPNPFRGTTSIEISTASPTAVFVEVSNISGQKVYDIDAGIINGSGSVELNAENLESGIYFYTVKTDNQSVTNKMIVK